MVSSEHIQKVTAFLFPKVQNTPQKYMRDMLMFHSSIKKNGINLNRKPVKED